MNVVVIGQKPEILGQVGVRDDVISHIDKELVVWFPESFPSMGFPNLSQRHKEVQRSRKERC